MQSTMIWYYGRNMKRLTLKGEPFKWWLTCGRDDLWVKLTCGRDYLLAGVDQPNRRLLRFLYGEAISNYWMRLSMISWINRRLVSYVDERWTIVQEVEVQDPDRTHTQGLKITEDNGCLCYDICKRLDILVFSDKGVKPMAPSPASSRH